MAASPRVRRHVSRELTRPLVINGRCINARARPDAFISLCAPRKSSRSDDPVNLPATLTWAGARLCFPAPNLARSSITFRRRALHDEAELAEFPGDDASPAFRASPNAPRRENDLGGGGSWASEIYRGDSRLDYCEEADSLFCRVWISNEVHAECAVKCCEMFVVRTWVTKIENKECRGVFGAKFVTNTPVWPTLTKLTTLL